MANKFAKDREQLNIRLKDKHSGLIDDWIKRLNDLDPIKKYSKTSLIHTLIESKDYVIKPYLSRDALILMKSFNNVNKTGSLLNRISRNLDYFRKKEVLSNKDYNYLKNDIAEFSKWLKTVLNVIEYDSKN